ncbi:MAG: secretion system protein E, partial [Methanoregula sp.]
SKDQLEAETKLRKEILTAMRDQGIRDYVSVSRIFQAYLIDPKQIIENLGDIRKVLK